MNISILNAFHFQTAEHEKVLRLFESASLNCHETGRANICLVTMHSFHLGTRLMNVHNNPCWPKNPTQPVLSSACFAPGTAPQATCLPAGHGTREDQWAASFNLFLSPARSSGNPGIPWVCSFSQVYKRFRVKKT